VNTLRAQLVFFPSNFLAICLNFQQQNSLKNQYPSHLSFENCEINSIKSDSPEGFPTPPRMTPNFLIQFSVSVLFNFHWKNGSIINSFHTIALKFVKYILLNLAHQELSKNAKNVPKFQYYFFIFNFH